MGELRHLGVRGRETWIVDDLLRERVGQTLRELRRERGLTLEQLARNAGVSRSHLSDIERGNKEASSEVIRSVHQTLGLTIDQLLDRARQPGTGATKLCALAA
ncbi:helix-turn-helix transcriptional regulator [Dietzia sp. CQ4]|nr:helix-turn-helix transcriptional regulator [Dietzia sp. CQ4]